MERDRRETAIANNNANEAFNKQKKHVSFIMLLSLSRG